uniref:holo-[acyl-carrier-protein] synthase n=1 Tax=Alexandrium monilatum TaxID=311494 RepID=A0A7S4S392_9DINO|mmetsp:Transcript_105010/g.313721  ORF Transcript_105010/g.313721 Transcript_105010/m.313721 type:complete len:555 (-) Transcript_105010:135-1799(-)
MEDPGASSATPNGNPLEGAGVGRLRWAVNSSEWKPAGEKDGKEFQFLVSLIREPSERESVSKFVRFVDQKRAVLSRLLVRRACAAVLGLSSFKAIEIARTKGKKPFLRCPRPPPERPDLGNFNFNVSHEGDWVVLASEPLCLCGVDVAAPHDRRQTGKEFDVFETFKEQLTEEEWRVVEREAASAVAKRMAKDKALLVEEFQEMDDPEADDFAERYDGVGYASGTANTARPLNQPVGYQAFQRFWSAKEAFVKARGDGLGFELNRAEFRFSSVSESSQTYVATIVVDGEPAPLWRCFQQRLGAHHWATVARGPTQDVVDAHGEFTRTLTRPTSSFPPHIWEQELLRESSPFDQVPVGFLVPPDDMQDYVAAGGTPWWCGPGHMPVPSSLGDSEAAGVKAEAPAESAAAGGERSRAPSAMSSKDSLVDLEDRGNKHFQNKEYQEALQCYTAAIEAVKAEATGTPTGSELYSLLLSARAGCLLETRDFDAALADADQAVQLDQGNAKAYFHKGRALEGLGRCEHALECLSQARQLAPADASVEQLLASVALKVSPK